MLPIVAHIVLDLIYSDSQVWRDCPDRKSITISIMYNVDTNYQGSVTMFLFGAIRKVL